MKKDEGLKAHEQALKELKEEKVKHLKDFIKKTLSRREELLKQKEELAKAIKILDKDIADSKEGRLDRIEERQKNDPLAKQTSVAIIEREALLPASHHDDTPEINHHHTEIRYVGRWYEPYRFVWSQPVLFPSNVMYCSASNNTGPQLQADNLMAGAGGNDANFISNQCFTLNNSIAADHTAGVYKLDSGTVKYV